MITAEPWAELQPGSWDLAPLVPAEDFTPREKKWEAKNCKAVLWLNPHTPWAWSKCIPRAGKHLPAELGWQSCRVLRGRGRESEKEVENAGWQLSARTCRAGAAPPRNQLPELGISPQSQLRGSQRLLGLSWRGAERFWCAPGTWGVLRGQNGANIHCSSKRQRMNPQNSFLWHQEGRTSLAPGK